MEKVLGKVWEQAAGEGGSKGGWVCCSREGTETTQWAIKQCDETSGLLWRAHQALAVSWQQAPTPCLKLGPRQSSFVALVPPWALMHLQAHAEQWLPWFPEHGSALVLSCFRSYKAGQGTGWTCVNSAPANPRSGRAGNCGAQTQEPPGVGPAEGWRMSSCFGPEVIKPAASLRKSTAASGTYDQGRSRPELVRPCCKGQTQMSLTPFHGIGLPGGSLVSSFKGTSFCKAHHVQHIPARFSC